MAWVKVISGFKIRKIKSELLHLAATKISPKNGAVKPPREQLNPDTCIIEF
jgi:hypothetical protein